MVVTCTLWYMVRPTPPFRGRDREASEPANGHVIKDYIITFTKIDSHFQVQSESVGPLQQEIKLDKNETMVIMHM